MSGSRDIEDTNDAIEHSRPPRREARGCTLPFVCNEITMAQRVENRIPSAGHCDVAVCQVSGKSAQAFGHTKCSKSSYSPEENTGFISLKPVFNSFNQVK